MTQIYEVTLTDLQAAAADEALSEYKKQVCSVEDSAAQNNRAYFVSLSTMRILDTGR